MNTAGICARYSSDNQRDASIEDQLRVCRAFAEKHGWRIAQEYTDRAVSGATHRGLRGRVESGKSGGGLCFGYRVVRSVHGTRDDLAMTGDDDQLVQMMMVAGARNHHYLQLWRFAT